MIRAHCYSDDGYIEVDFDATPWFLQADDQEIVEVAIDGFGGGYGTDAIADWERIWNPAVDKMFAYVESTQGTNAEQGFGCEVVESDATAWVQEHRPHLIHGGEIRAEKWGPKDWRPISRSPKKKK